MSDYTYPKDNVGRDCGPGDEADDREELDLDQPSPAVPQTVVLGSRNPGKEQGRHRFVTMYDLGAGLRSN